MPTLFAALEARANRAVLRHLANATAQYGSGEAFPVLLQRELVQPYGEVLDAAGYACSFELASAPTVAEGQRLTIDGTHYTVASGPVVDTSGWVRVVVHPEA